jgi:hypothetical protein
MNTENLGSSSQFSVSLRNRLRGALAIVVLSTLTGGCEKTVEQTNQRASHRDLAASLRTVSGARVFFAHQSVGDNIVSGLRELEKSGAEPALHLVDMRDASQAVGPAFMHARLGENGHPRTKTDAFNAVLDTAGLHVNLAMQKYCFADFDASTDVQSVFAYYRDSVDRIHARYPRLKLVHITAPLMTVQSGPRALVKKIIGRIPDNYAENDVRERFNDLMRLHYANREPLFDLAALEAALPGAKDARATLNGRTFFVLRPEYSTDGGHLTIDAAKRVATELVLFLATVLDEPDLTLERASAWGSRLRTSIHLPVRAKQIPGEARARRGAHYSLPATHGSPPDWPSGGEVREPTPAGGIRGLGARAGRAYGSSVTPRCSAFAALGRADLSLIQGPSGTRTRGLTNQRHSAKGAPSRTVWWLRPSIGAGSENASESATGVPQRAIRWPLRGLHRSCASERRA